MSVAREDAVHEIAAVRLRSVGQRYTAQRRRLIDILARAGRPVSIPEILRGRRGLAQSSVYRNLSDLVEAGIVRRVLTGDEFGKYELSEDLTEHHHHLICSSCGRTKDVTLPATLEKRLDVVIDEIAVRAEFADVAHRLDMIGTCAECAARLGAGG
ncbi:MAG: Fur family transcriptional regulator [Actinomycetota bacterium]